MKNQIDLVAGTVLKKRPMKFCGALRFFSGKVQPCGLPPDWFANPYNATALMQYLDRYTPEQARRHEVKPGLTGWAQINGRNAISWEEKFKLDVWYVDNQSIWLDLKIIGMTIRKVLLREGISAVGEATMPEFMGSREGVRTKSG